MEIPHYRPQISRCQKIVWNVLYRKYQSHWNQELAIDFVQSGHVSRGQNCHTLQVRILNDYRVSQQAWNM